MADISSIKLPSGNTYDIKDSTARNAIPTKVSQLTNDSGFITGMTILSYGSSTWADFEAAYNANKVVYCRASSNANPASGSQTRLAFMAYVNNATTPTNVEFQYYRSVKSHTASQQGDQVFVYKLDKTSGWSVTVREAYTKIVAGTGLDSSYANGTLSLTCSGGGNTLVFTNKTVAASAWSSNSDLDYYGYRASIPLTGVTASMMPQVTFTDSQMTEWDLAPICQSYAGGVYIYSAEAISEAITIPSIGLIGG